MTTLLALVVIGGALFLIVPRVEVALGDAGWGGGRGERERKSRHSRQR